MRGEREHLEHDTRQGENLLAVGSWAACVSRSLGGVAPIYRPSIRDCLLAPFQVRREF